MHEAVEVRAPQLGRETGPSEERVLRRVDLQRRRPRSHGQEPDPEHGAAPEGGCGQPERLAPVAPPREGGRDEQDREADQEELGMGEAAPREHERGQDGRPASRIVQQRARREERRRRDQVRDVPGREVDGERARQQPRERPPAGARSAADEGRGRETDRHPDRDLERRGRLHDREPERPLEHERQRGRPGPVRDRGQAFDAGEPGPPQVDRRVGTHRERRASCDERPEEPREQDEGEGRDQERVGPVRPSARPPVRDATPAR